MAVNSQEREVLIEEALKVRDHAYAPYSKYSVGAALLAGSGNIYTGANVENASYPLTICAERAAIAAAVSKGERKFDAIVVATKNGGSPCGACRQVMAEFAPDMEVFIIREDGTIDLETTVADLIPHFFGPGDLPGN